MQNRGKWSQPGVPHKGWICVDIEDLDDDRQICEMCESQEIRYVHYMSHPGFPNVLACGCDCAGHMEGNLARADARDKSMRNSAARRKKFPDLKSWKISQKGNWTLSRDGKRITIFGWNGRYKFVINHPLIKDGKFSRTSYETVHQAKLAAFDASIWLDDNWQQFLNY